MKSAASIETASSSFWKAREREKRTVCLNILQKWSREREQKRPSERDEKRRCFRMAKKFFSILAAFEEIVSGAGNLKRSSSFEDEEKNFLARKLVAGQLKKFSIRSNDGVTKASACGFIGLF